MVVNLEPLFQKLKGALKLQFKIDIIANKYVLFTAGNSSNSSECFISYVS